MVKRSPAGHVLQRTSLPTSPAVVQRSSPLASSLRALASAMPYGGMGTAPDAHVAAVQDAATPGRQSSPDETAQPPRGDAQTSTMVQSQPLEEEEEEELQAAPARSDPSRRHQSSL